jgi:hypothetical protein
VCGGADKLRRTLLLSYRCRSPWAVELFSRHLVYFIWRTTDEIYFFLSSV